MKNYPRRHLALLTAASSMAMLMAGGAMAQEAATPAPSADSDTVVVVTGIRASLKRAVNLKRDADQVIDSVSSEDIGKFPDATISDSLQRIPGVQVRREAGEAGAVNIRGLPQVATLLNGEAFLGANSITNVQPNFGDIPSQLMSGADVIKSTTATQLGAGITGTVNLKTWRPFDFKKGLTLTGAIEGAYGDQTKKWEPNANVLGSWRNGTFGALISVAYSDTTAANYYNGMNGNSGWSGKPDEGSFALPVFEPTGLNSGGLAFASGDQNGNGTTNDEFISYEGHVGFNKSTERKRTGVNAAFQWKVNDAIQINAEYFHTEQTQWNREVGIDAENKWSSWGWFAPVSATDTGYDDGGKALYTVQEYKINALRLGTYTETDRYDSKSDNFNLALNYDNGGNFSFNARILHAKATQLNINSYAGQSLGTEYQYADCPNATSTTPCDAANNPGDTVGQNHFPDGDHVTNPTGFTGLQAINIDYSGDSPVWSGLDAALLGNKANYVMDGASSENNYDRESTMDVARFDGHYRVNDDLKFDFGARYSNRDMRNDQFAYLAPLYKNYSAVGAGALDGQGCLVKWKSTDVVINGGDGNAGCHAGDAGGYFTASPGIPLTAYGNDVIAVNNFGGVGGIPTAYAIDPHAMDDPLAWQEKYWPGEVRVADPGASFSVGIKQEAAYGQMNLRGVAGVPYRLNAGVQVIRTELDVVQNLPGASGLYGAPNLNNGTKETQRDFTDVLPSFNISFDLRDDLKLRGAFSKNMTILDAAQWGGALSLSYSKDSATGNFLVIGGNESGNPNLDPWRSTNYDVSLEWYNAPGSLFSVGVFYVEIASFIENVSVMRDYPDQTGGGHRMVSINTSGQGAGGTLKGIELNAKQAFTYLPGFWSNFGIDANYTYSPSSSGQTDLAGDDLPFQDNSVHQVNASLWYQNGPWQARIADNYRSKRAVASNQVWGTTGLELYQKPTNYVDASVSYEFMPNMTVYLQGSNLTGEKESYYFQWENQYAYQNVYEKRVTLGLRAKF
jgi:TonB-dependent receptor